MKKIITGWLLILLLLGGCIPEDPNSEQIRGLIFEPSYGIDAPQITSVSQIGMDINILWNRVANASFYHLYVAINLPDNFVMVTTFENNEAVMKNLEVGKTYFFYVTAINEYGVESSASNIVSITVQ
jgi:hypothetical protein